MPHRTVNQDTGSLKVGRFEASAGDLLVITGEANHRRVTSVSGRPSRGTVCVHCKGTGPMPIGQVEFELLRGGVPLAPLAAPPQVPAHPLRARGGRSRAPSEEKAPPPPGVRRTHATRFDAYVIVDWSASTKRAPVAPRRDTVWVSSATWDGDALAWEPERHFRTRRACIDELVRWLEAATERGLAVLVGFDFPLGYPQGFAAGLSVTRERWRGVWNVLRDPPAHLPEAPANEYATETNTNNRFEVAAALNAAVSLPGTRPPGPFHGSPRTSSHLGNERPAFRYSLRGGASVAYWRRTEERLRDAGLRPLSAWWVLGGRKTPTVGGQAIVGIPAVDELRERLGGTARVWPFDTGFTSQLARRSPDGKGVIVIAEVWPGLVNDRLHPGLIRDAAQVRATAAWFASKDATDELTRDFECPQGLDPEERNACESEEGWILGVR